MDFRSHDQFKASSRSTLFPYYDEGANSVAIGANRKEKSADSADRRKQVPLAAVGIAKKKKINK